MLQGECEPAVAHFGSVEVEDVGKVRPNPDQGRSYKVSIQAGTPCRAQGHLDASLSMLSFLLACNLLKTSSIQ